MKNLFLLLLFNTLIISCNKKKDTVEPDDVVTTYDSIEVFDATKRLGIAKVTYQNSKIISLNYFIDGNQPQNGITGYTFHYGEDDYLDSTVETENGQLQTGDRYLYDAQKRLSFWSYYYSEYAHRFLYKTDSILIKHYDNPCYPYEVCEMSPENFNLTYVKTDTLVLNSQGDILTINKQPVIYAPNAPTLSLQDLYKLQCLFSSSDYIVWSIISNRKPIESIPGSPYNYKYQFNGDKKISEIIYTTSTTYNRLVFHY